MDFSLFKRLSKFHGPPKPIMSKTIGILIPFGLLASTGMLFFLTEHSDIREESILVNLKHTLAKAVKKLHLLDARDAKMKEKVLVLSKIIEDVAPGSMSLIKSFDDDINFSYFDSPAMRLKVAVLERINVQRRIADSLKAKVELLGSMFDHFIPGGREVVKNLNLSGNPDEYEWSAAWMKLENEGRELFKRKYKHCIAS
jgi:hypothetical protein